MIPVRGASWLILKPTPYRARPMPSLPPFYKEPKSFSTPLPVLPACINYPCFLRGHTLASQAPPTERSSLYRVLLRRSIRSFHFLFFFSFPLSSFFSIYRFFFFLFLQSWLFDFFIKQTSTAVSSRFVRFSWKFRLVFAWFS